MRKTTNWSISKRVSQDWQIKFYIPKRDSKRLKLKQEVFTTIRVHHSKQRDKWLPTRKKAADQPFLCLALSFRPIRILSSCSPSFSCLLVSFLVRQRRLWRHFTLSLILLCLFTLLRLYSFFSTFLMSQEDVKLREERRKEEKEQRQKEDLPSGKKRQSDVRGWVEDVRGRKRMGGK